MKKNGNPVSVAAARVWNSLPPLASSSPSLPVFRWRLKLGSAELPFKARYGLEWNVENYSESVWYGMCQIPRNGSNSKFVCVLCVTKHCGMGVLQVASIVGLLPAFLEAFHEPTYSEFQKEFGWHRSISEIPILNRVSDFRRPLDWRQSFSLARTLPLDAEQILQTFSRCVPHYFLPHGHDFLRTTRLVNGARLL